MLFDTMDTVVRLMRKTSTRTGLTSTVHVIDKFYQTARKVRDSFVETARIIYHKLLPKWNYTALPNPCLG